MRFKRKKNLKENKVWIKKGARRKGKNISTLLLFNKFNSPVFPLNSNEPNSPSGERDKLKVKLILAANLFRRSMQ